VTRFQKSAFCSAIVIALWVIFIVCALFVTHASANEIKVAKPDAPRAKVSKEWIVLTAASFVGAGFDMAETLQTCKIFKKRDWNTVESCEGERIMRPFVAMPAPAYIATGLASVAALSYLSYRMQRSHHWYRKIWWVPQSVQIKYSVRGGISQATNWARR
jgi:hypothetical protein